MTGLEIETVESSIGVPVLHLRGEIDLHTCGELRTTLQRLMESGRYQIILDLGGVPYLDSAALGVLVDAVRRARENNGALYLARITPFVLRAFEITRLIKIFQVHPTVEAALAALSGNSGATV